MSKIKVAVMGAAGYAGEELLRILLQHENVEITAITSRKNAGQAIEEVFPRFSGSGLAFCEPNVDELAKNCDVAFLALPHGLAAEYAVPLLNNGVRVIDISADFRLRDTDQYRKYYGVDHPAPELLKDAVYGQPERYREQLKDAKLVACAGCYVTSIILAASPLLEAKLVSPKNIVAACMSGVSGAGRKVDLAYIFPECNESLKAYKPYGHRHLPEIEQELAIAADVEQIKMSFIPHLVPVNRGINSTIVFDASPDCTIEKITQAFAKSYDNERFVRVLPAGHCSDTKYVTMSNVCEIGYSLDPHANKVIVTSVIDNLTKGASGQAVQCFNIMFGLPENQGLN